jgi:hypothetical protein
MEVSSQHHTGAVLPPRKKPVPIDLLCYFVMLLFMQNQIWLTVLFCYVALYAEPNIPRRWNIFINPPPPHTHTHTHTHTLHRRGTTTLEMIFLACRQQYTRWSSLFGRENFVYRNCCDFMLLDLFWDFRYPAYMSALS